MKDVCVLTISTQSAQPLEQEEGTQRLPQEEGGGRVRC